MIRSSGAGRGAGLLLVVAMGWALTACAQDLQIPDAIAAVKPAVVLIVATGPGQATGSGTGFVVDRAGLIVTSAHVVEDAKTVTVIAGNEENVLAEVVGVDEDHDLALLKVASERPSAASLGSFADLREGDSVLVTGYPFGNMLGGAGLELTATTTRGMVTAIRTGPGLVTDTPAKFIQIDARANPGNSGGPVYLARTAEVIGVLAAEIRPFGGEQTGLNIAIPVQYVSDLMAAVREGRATVPPPRETRAERPFPVAPAAPEEGLPGGGLPISADVGAMVADPRSARVYVTEDRLNALTVIDADSGRIVQRVSVGSEPAGIALSPEHSALYVALSGGSQLAVIDLETLAVREPIQLDIQPYDLAYVAKDTLYVTGKGPGNRPPYCLVNPSDGTHAPGVGLYHNALVRAQPGGPLVLFGQTCLSPASMFRCDRAADPLALEGVGGHGDIGSNLRDFRLSPDGRRLYICCGAPYHVQILDVATFRPIGQFRTGPYPRHVALSPDGSRAFVSHGGEHVDVFDTNSFLSMGSIGTPSNVVNMVVTSDGGKLAILCETGLWIADLAQITLAPRTDTPPFTPARAATVPAGCGPLR